MKKKIKKPHKSKREKWMGRIGIVLFVLAFLGIWAVCLLNLFVGNPVTPTGNHGQFDLTWALLVFLTVVTPIVIIAVWQDLKNFTVKKPKGKQRKDRHEEEPFIKFPWM